jgi:AraC family transcriptional regulator
MTYQLIEKAAFTIIGKVTTIIDKRKYEMIPQFWNDCKEEGIINKLHKFGGSRPIIGVGENGNISGTFKYMIGIESETANVDELQVMIIPKSTWAVFEPVLSEPRYVAQVWKYIFSDFLPNGEYRLANTPDLEVNYRIGIEQYKCEIWIPVVNKG